MPCTEMSEKKKTISDTGQVCARGKHEDNMADVAADDDEYPFAVGQAFHTRFVPVAAHQHAMVMVNTFAH